jgi:hypothetical protein
MGRLIVVVEVVAIAVLGLEGCPSEAWDASVRGLWLVLCDGGCSRSSRREGVVCLTKAGMRGVSFLRDRRVLVQQ